MVCTQVLVREPLPQPMLLRARTPNRCKRRCDAYTRVCLCELACCLPPSTLHSHRNPATVCFAVVGASAPSWHAHCTVC